MPNQKVYYVPPRLVGPLQEWSGMDSAGGQSWLIDHVQDLKFNAIWFSPLNTPTEIEKDAHGKKVTGSYYAIRDHFSVNPEFSSGFPAEDKKHLLHFNKQAADNGIRVYADLVFNHIAADHPLVLAENKEIKDILDKTGGKVRLEYGNKDKVIGLSYDDGDERKSMSFKFRRTYDLSLQVGGPRDDPWTDVAQINYSSPEARRFFIDGDDKKQGYFKDVIDWNLDHGFTAFRCDAAYNIPPESWQALITHAKRKQPDCLFLAETTGGPDDKIARLAAAKIKDASGKERPAFDMGMLGIYWWDYVNDYLPKSEHPRVQSMSKFGGAGSPDNHDTPGTLAGNLRKMFNHHANTEEGIARVCVRDYAISALACNSVYMQMGFEYCNEKQNGVFRGQVVPEDWDALVTARAGKDHALDISARIREINAIKDDLGVDNCRVEFRDFRPVQDGKIVKIHCAYVDVDTNKTTAEVVLYVNKKPEKGGIVLAPQELGDMDKTGLVMRFGGGADKNPVIDDVVIYHTPFSAAPAVNAAPIPQRKKRVGNGPAF